MKYIWKISRINGAISLQMIVAFTESANRTSIGIKSKIPEAVTNYFYIGTNWKNIGAVIPVLPAVSRSVSVICKKTHACLFA